MQFQVPTIASCLVVLGLLSLPGTPRTDHRNQAVQRSVEAYQRALIARDVTGGSVAGVFKGPDTVAFSIVNSGLVGDMPIAANTIFPMMSMSKPITVVAMMILYEKGLYSLDDPVMKYLPYFAEMNCKDKTEKTYRCKNELKIIHLLTHRSGYRYYDRGKGPDFLDPHENLDQFAKSVAAYPAEFEPGTDYVYGLNMAILGRVVEVLSGKEFYAFLKENVFDPLDMPHTKFELSADDRKHFQVLFKKPEPLGDPVTFDEGTSVFSTADDYLAYAPGTKAQFGGEGLVSTFEDYRHFCEMLLAKGSFRGRRIVTERSITMMTSVTTKGRLIRGFNNGQDYGYSLWVLTEPALDGTGTPKGTYGWSGAHNTHFWIDYENGVYGLFMTRTSPFSWEIQKQFRAAVYRSLH